MTRDPSRALVLARELRQAWPVRLRTPKVTRRFDSLEGILMRMIERAPKSERKGFKPRPRAKAVR